MTLLFFSTLLTLTTTTSTPSGTSVADQLPLQDIITPNHVSAWPPAIGWWILLLIVLALVFYAIKYYREYKKKWGYRVEALQLLELTLKDWQDKKINDEIAIQHLLSVLKRTAISAYPKQHHNNAKNISSVAGKQWLHILKTQAPAIETNTDIDQIIVSTQYQKNADLSPTVVYQFCKQWIRQHKTQWQGEGN